MSAVQPAPAPNNKLCFPCRFIAGFACLLFWYVVIVPPGLPEFVLSGEQQAQQKNQTISQFPTLQFHQQKKRRTTGQKEFLSTAQSTTQNTNNSWSSGHINRQREAKSTGRKLSQWNNNNLYGLRFIAQREKMIKVDWRQGVRVHRHNKQTPQLVLSEWQVEAERARCSMRYETRKKKEFELRERGK